MMNLHAVRAATLVALAFTFSAAATAQAASPALKPGEYITERGWGSLTLKPGKNGALAFSIGAVGANAHSCSLEGELRGGKAELEAEEKDKPCVVTMTAKPEGIQVSSGESSACRYYCGMRAHFDGLYFQPPPACTGKAVAASRKSFKQLYDAKKFAEARAKLEPVLKDCAKVLGWLEDGRMRNDMAVTLHKLGDLAGCRAVLDPLAEDAALTDEQVRDGYPPADADSYLPIVKSTRTNLKLCREK